MRRIRAAGEDRRPVAREGARGSALQTTDFCLRAAGAYQQQQGPADAMPDLLYLLHNIGSFSPSRRKINSLPTGSFAVRGLRAAFEAGSSVRAIAAGRGAAAWIHPCRTRAANFRKGMSSGIWVIIPRLAGSM